MPCQIVVLHVQSKQRRSKAAMQALHDVWQNFVIFFRSFWREDPKPAVFFHGASDFASAECQPGCDPVAGKPLADVRFSC